MVLWTRACAPFFHIMSRPHLQPSPPSPTPDYLFSFRDVKEALRKSCYSNAKAKHGPKTHHICFYFGYGANSFGKKKMKKEGGGRRRIKDWPDTYACLVCLCPCSYACLRAAAATLAFLRFSLSDQISTFSRLPFCLLPPQPPCTSRTSSSLRRRTRRPWSRP